MSWKAWLAVELAAAAGIVDATGLTGVGHYSSHMSGTTTHSIVGFVVGDNFPLFGFGMLTVACFLSGAIGAGVVVTHPSARKLSATLAVLVGIETVLVLAGGVAMALLPAGSWSIMAVIAGFAAAMGVQNAASTYLLDPYERTTHVTSNMTDFGCELGMRLRGWAGMSTGDKVASPALETMVSAGLPIIGFGVGGLAGALLHLVAGSWSGIVAAAPPALATLWLLAAARSEKAR
jgi:uncharacterized membrane protein YoaK (UPF0700 family)